MSSSTRNFISKSIILTRRPLGEKNLLLKIFSEDLGLIDAIAYGAQSMGSKLQTANTIGALGTAYFYVQPNRSLHTLREFDVDLYQNRYGDLYLFLYFSLWAEVLIATFGSGTEYQKSFSLLSAALKALIGYNKESYYQLATARFLWRYLQINGNLPQSIYCEECGTPFSKSETIIYINTHFYCQHCSAKQGENRGQRYAAQLIDDFIHHTNTTFHELLQSDWAINSAYELCDFASLYTQHTIGRRLKSLQVISSFFHSYST